MVILVEFKNALFCVLSQNILTALGIANLQNYTEPVKKKLLRVGLCVFSLYFISLLCIESSKRGTPIIFWFSLATFLIWTICYFLPFLFFFNSQGWHKMKST